MKVSFNLAVTSTSRERYALAWALPLAALALAGLASVCSSAARGIRDYRRVHAERLNLLDQEARANRVEKDLRRDLEQPQFHSLYRETQFVNSLIAQKRVSVTGLAARITELLPPSLRLTGLALVDKDGERAVRVTITGSSVEAVENFVLSLEDSSDFRDPEILNRSIEESGAAAGQVTVTCTARYLGDTER